MKNKFQFWIISLVLLIVLGVTFPNESMATLVPIEKGNIKKIVVGSIYVNSKKEINIKPSIFETTFGDNKKGGLMRWVPKVTNGKMKVKVDVLPPIKISSYPLDCNLSGLQAELKNTVFNITKKSYDYYYFYFNNQYLDCGWAGITMLNDHQTVFFNDNYSKTVNHEFGHLIGLDHARGYNCEVSGVGINTSSCTGDEYGDSLGIMGSSYYYPGYVFNIYERIKLGLVNMNNIHVVNSDGVYNILNSNKSRRGKLGIRIPRIGEYNGSVFWNYYWVEYRDFPLYPHRSKPGVVIRVGSDPFIDTGMKDVTGLINPLQKSACWKSMPFVTRDSVFIDNVNKVLIGVGRISTRSVNVKIKYFGDNDPMSLIRKKGKNCFIK